MGMKITRRYTNKKRHTKGYCIDGERMTRGRVVKLARRGKINNVIARRGPYGWYITSTNMRRNLYDLPVVVES